MVPQMVDVFDQSAENAPVNKASKDEVIRFLLEESVFHGASPSSIERLSSMAIQKSIPKDSLLFSMGEHCEALHIVVEGCGALVRISPDGRQRILHRATAGEMVGAVPFFDHGEYPASFLAETDCLVLAIPRDALLKLFAEDPGISFGLVGTLVERLRSFVSIIEQMSFDDVGHRLWDFLMKNSSSLSGGEFPRVVDSLPTRERIANAIGSVREVVSRRLSRLAESGHVRVEGRRLLLLKALA